MCAEYSKDQVIFAVKKLFAGNEIDAVFNVLSLESKDTYRTYLAVLKLSRGNLEDFHDYFKKAQEDYRDVLWWAEYDNNDKNKKIENPYKEILR